MSELFRCGVMVARPRFTAVRFRSEKDILRNPPSRCLRETIAMNLGYRQIQVDDVPAVFAVRISTVENALTMEQLERDYGAMPQSLLEGMKSHLRGWLCEDSGTAVGFAIGDRSNGEVQVVAIRPEYEANGIGKNLLSRVQAWLFSEGHELIWLLANPDPKTRAHGFYRHLGWRPTGTLKGNDEVMTLQPDKPLAGS